MLLREYLQYSLSIKSQGLNRFGYRYHLVKLAHSELSLASGFSSVNLGVLFQVPIFHNGHIGIWAIEDSCNLLQSRTLGFDVKEVDEDKFNSDPDLEWQTRQSCTRVCTRTEFTYRIEAPEIPVVW